jgi:hypothetical protein
MSYVGSDFSTTDDVESEVYGLNFAPIMGGGETIATVTSYLVAISGTDPDAATRLVGSPTINELVVSQMAGPLLANCTYRIGFTILTSLGMTKNLYSHVTCLAPN